MIDPESPIIDFYPTEFKSDLNGKRQAWQAVVLLPFIDEVRLLDTLALFENQLSAEEARRNQRWGNSTLYIRGTHPLAVVLSALYQALPNPGLTDDKLILDPAISSLCGSISPYVEQRLKRPQVPGVHFPANMRGFPDIEVCRAYAAAYFNPVFGKDFIFPSRTLSNAVLPHPVLRDSDFAENGRRPNYFRGQNAPASRMLNNSLRAPKKNFMVPDSASNIEAAPRASSFKPHNHMSASWGYYGDRETYAPANLTWQQQSAFTHERQQNFQQPHDPWHDHESQKDYRQVGHRNQPPYYQSNRYQHTRQQADSQEHGNMQRTHIPSSPPPIAIVPSPAPISVPPVSTYQFSAPPPEQNVYIPPFPSQPSRLVMLQGSSKQFTFAPQPTPMFNSLQQAQTADNTHSNVNQSQQLQPQLNQIPIVHITAPVVQPALATVAFLHQDYNRQFTPQMNSQFSPQYPCSSANVTTTTVPRPTFVCSGTIPEYSFCTATPSKYFSLYYPQPPQAGTSKA